MQTFLPYADFDQTAKCLDFRRLGKQRVEAMQILKALCFPGTSRWEHHPAVKMWSGCEEALALYYNTIVREWVRRGYRNTMPSLLLEDIVLPSWLGSESFHASHRSNLLRKDPEWYGQFGWDEPSDLPYIWPKGER